MQAEKLVGFIEIRPPGSLNFYADFEWKPASSTLIF